MDAWLWLPKGVANPSQSPLLDVLSNRALVGFLPDDVISYFQDLPKTAVNGGLDPSHDRICCLPGITTILAALALHWN